MVQAESRGKTRFEIAEAQPIEATNLFCGKIIMIEGFVKRQDILYLCTIFHNT